MRTLYTHAHLIVDEYKQYLDGAILIKDKYIEDVFFNSNKIDIKDVETIDLKGKILMPSFYVIDETKLKIVDPLNYHNEYINDVVMLGNSNAYMSDIKDVKYDGIYNLYEKMTPYSHNKKGLVNLAFENRDKYVMLNPIKIDREVLKFTLNNLRRDRVILIGDNDINIKIMKEININLNDILAYQVLNAYKLFNDDKLKGTLLKGKYADLMILDQEYKVIERIEKGYAKVVD